MMRASCVPSSARSRKGEEMDLRVTKSDRAPAPVGPYSQPIVAGDLIFCAGQLALDPTSGELVGANDVREQTRRVLDNLAAVLSASDSSLDRVSKTTVFLTGLKEFTRIKAVYEGRFGTRRRARVREVSSAMGCAAGV